MRVLWQNGGRGGAMFTPTNSFILLGFLRLCQFSENPSKNASVRVYADGYTNIRTEANLFYNLCPMLYAIASVWNR